MERESTPLYQALFKCIYGGIIGDALGVPYEFCERGTFHAETMTGAGSYNQTPGTWSDDSSLTLCLLHNFATGGSLNDLLDKFIMWFEKGAYTPHGTSFGSGTTTRNAILRHKLGVCPQYCGDIGKHQNGNGALMRIAPLVFMLRNEENFSMRERAEKEYSEITHKHPRSILACIIFIETLRNILKGNRLEAAVQKASDICQSQLCGTEYAAEFNCYRRIFSGELLDADIDTINSTPYVVYTLEAALWSCFHSSNFREAILTAVNLGDDADTVGAVTGNIAGLLYYRDDTFPDDWYEAIARKEFINTIIDGFYDALHADAGA